MNKLYSAAVLLASLAAPLATHAHDDERGRGNPDAMEWRADGHAILYRYPGERRWQRAPGSAHDVGEGWVIGTDRRNGGYGIYRWNGRGWSRMPGSGVEIGGSFNNPWVINDRGERFTWTGYDWQQEYRGNSRRDRDYRGDHENERRRDEGRGRDNERHDNGDWDRDDGRWSGRDGGRRRR